MYDQTGVCGTWYNGQLYSFTKNVFGDITGIITGNGTLTAQYKYNAWGGCTVTTAAGAENTTATFIGNLNPFRYRGYFYDQETGFYYLQTRYYDPVVCRFLTPDSPDYLEPTTFGGLNLYAYCYNNPVMHADPSGHMPEWLSDVGRFIGGLLITGIGIGLMAATIISGGGLCLLPGFGNLLQAELSLTMYGGFMMASSWDPLIQSDMEAINWNPFNSNPDMSHVNKVSFYKGEAVVIQSFARSSFSFGIMGLHVDDKNNVNAVKHEWGHFAQLALYGPAVFTTFFALPSYIYNCYCDIIEDWTKYYEKPWEASADYLGGVKR